MKRKVKFLSSIFSLTLAMLVLSAGVFALADKQVGVTGKISFTSTNVAAKVDVTQTMSGQTDVPQSHTFTLSNQGGADMEVGFGTSPNKVIPFTDTVVTYVLNVKITNNFTSGGSSITVTESGNPLVGTPTGLKVVKSGVTGTSTTITAGNSATFTYTYTLTPLTAPTFTATELINMAFTLARG